MATLTIMEQGLALAVDGELFSIERDGKVVDRVRMADVDEVLLFGAISLTPAAVGTVLRRGIDTVFLTARGRYRGRLVGKPGRNVELRLAQFQRLRDPAASLALARSFVAGKIANQRYVLLRAQREQKSEDFAGAIGRLRRIMRTVEESPDMEVLRGLEGQAGAAYFKVLGRCIRNPQFTFSRRTRRPPRDPANAMLSFGYTLLGIVMESAVLRAGLDPMVGAFHAPDYGRPSLVLDLIEEFRAILVDSLMLRLVNRREIAPEDFEAPDQIDPLEADDLDGEGPGAAAEAVWLGASGRRVFFRAWSRRLRETHFYEARQQTLMLEEILQQQVYHLARVITGEEESYRAFVVR